MTLDDFESQARAALSRTLEQLHTATLMVATLEQQLLEAGMVVQNLSHQIEECLANQRQQAGSQPPVPPDEPPPSSPSQEA